MRRSSIPIVAALALALVPACGDDEQTSTDIGDTLQTVQFDVPDVTVDASFPDDFGDSCGDNDDCISGYCIQGPNGFVCTTGCDSQCPTGWACKGITSGSADVVFVCVPDDVAPDTSVGDTDASGGDTSSTTPTDTGATTVTDTGGPTDTNSPDTVTPVGSICDPSTVGSGDNFLVEPGDFADCITDCPNASQVGLVEIDLQDTVYTGVKGIIDGSTHQLPGPSDTIPGPDIDVINIKAAPRAMIEIGIFASDPGSLIEPLVYVSDGFQIRTFNSDVSASNNCARTTIAFPYVSNVPLYIAVEDERNYDAYSPDGYGPTVGGSSYGWSMRIRTTPFAPTELGQMNAGTQQSVTGQILTQGGETRYYRVMAPGTARPTVTLTRTGSTSFVPALGGFKTDQNQLVWQLVRYDDDANGTVILPEGAFIGCLPGQCTSAPVEYIFAVYDWNGNASPGAFTYDLNVSIP